MMEDTSEKLPTGADIRLILATLLSGAIGDSIGQWERRIGPVTVHPIAFKPRCNWQVNPKGQERHLKAIKKAVELLAAEQPYARSQITF